MDKNETPKDFSKPVQELIGTAPAWPVRYGAMAVLSIILGSLLCCCFIRFPDTVGGPITITSSAPPASLIAKKNAVIDTVLVINRSHVKEGAVIAVLRSSASYEDIVYCEKTVNLCRSVSFETMSLIHFNRDLKLGEVQEYWTEFASSVNSYREFVRINKAGRSSEIATRRAGDKIKRLEALKSQADILEQDLVLQETENNRTLALMKDGYISLSEYEQSLQVVLSKQASLYSIRAEIEKLSAEIRDADNTRLELGVQKDNELSERSLAVARSLDNLSGAILRWKENYTINAPTSGTVSLIEFISRGRPVESGELVGVILPDEDGIIMGRLLVSTLRFGKVKAGQRVDVRLDAFPYTEFGILYGLVSDISDVPVQNDNNPSYSVLVSFPEEMKTSYGFKVPQMMEMRGQADIEVEKLKLIHHIITPVKSLFFNVLGE